MIIQDTLEIDMVSLAMLIIVLGKMTKPTLIL